MPKQQKIKKKRVIRARWTEKFVDYIPIAALRASFQIHAAEENEKLDDIEEDICTYHTMIPALVYMNFKNAKAKKPTLVVVRGKQDLRVAEKLGYTMAPIIFLRFTSKKLEHQLEYESGRWTYDILALLAANFLWHVGSLGNYSKLPKLAHQIKEGS